MRSAFTTIGLLSFALLACDKGAATSAEGAPSASPTPTASAASLAPATSTAAAAPAAASATAASTTPAVAAPKCPPGFTGNAVPAYCIKLPAAYTVKDARTTPTKGSIDYETGSATDNLMITYDTTSLAEQTKDVEGELKFGGDKLEKKGDMPAGKWFQGSHQDFEHIVTLVKGQPPVTLKCSFAYKPKNAPPKEAIDACKSIVVPSGS